MWAASQLFENVVEVPMVFKYHAIEACRVINVRLHAFTDLVTGRMI
jgi:hypothetical protein